MHTLYISSGAEKTNPFGVGFYNTSASGEGGTWFKIENGKGIIGGGYTAQYTPTETGRFYVSLAAYVAPNYSALGSYSPSAVFEFEVVNGDPVIESKEDVLAYKGMTYDLSAFFNVWHLGKKENAIFEFKLDGVACADGKLIADGLNHSAKLTITDEYGNKASGVAEIRGAEIVIDEEVKITPFKGKSVGFARTVCSRERGRACELFFEVKRRNRQSFVYGGVVHVCERRHLQRGIYFRSGRRDVYGEGCAANR